MDTQIINENKERIHYDIEQIHELATQLLPFGDDIAQKNLTQPEAAAQLAVLTDILHELHPADMADILEHLPKKERALVWAIASPEEDGEVLLEVSDSVRESLIDEMNTDELIAAIEDMDTDELADLVSVLPENVVQEALKDLDEEERAQLETMRSYSDGQVGAVMDFEIVSIRADVACEVVLRYLRRFDALPDHTDKIFVVNEQDILQGVLPIRKLLVADPEELVENVMATEIVMFRAEDDVEEAAAAFERYDLVTAPVVDADRKLIGRITVDEMLDVIREESTSDILNMAGLKEEEDLYAPVWRSVKNRWKWVALNLCTALGASFVISFFEQSIAKIVALAALMPIVAGIGGNSGNQTITMIVRALSSTTISNAQAWILLRKELSVALVNGLVWGGVMGLVSYWMYANVGISVLMVVAMTLNLLLSAIFGVLIPVGLEKLGRDPAMGSSVMITAATDMGGFFIFLGLATWWLL